MKTRESGPHAANECRARVGRRSQIAVALRGAMPTKAAVSNPRAACRRAVGSGQEQRPGPTQQTAETARRCGSRCNQEPDLAAASIESVGPVGTAAASAAGSHFPNGNRQDDHGADDRDGDVARARRTACTVARIPHTWRFVLPGHRRGRIAREGSRSRDLAGEQVPAHRPLQTLGHRRYGRGRELVRVERYRSRSCAEHELFPNCGREAGEHLDRLGHTPMLDPADRLLGRPSPVRQRGLAVRAEHGALERMSPRASAHHIWCCVSGGRYGPGTVVHVVCVSLAGRDRGPMKRRRVLPLRPVSNRRVASSVVSSLLSGFQCRAADRSRSMSGCSDERGRRWRCRPVMLREQGGL